MFLVKRRSKYITIYFLFLCSSIWTFWPIPLGICLKAYYFYILSTRIMIRRSTVCCFKDNHAISSQTSIICNSRTYREIKMIQKYQQKHRLKIQWLRSSLGPPHPTAVCLDWSPGPTSSLSFLIIPEQQHVPVRVLGFPAFHAQNPAWVSGFCLQPALA